MKWRLHVTTLYGGNIRTDVLEFQSRNEAEMAKHRFETMARITYHVMPLY